MTFRPDFRSSWIKLHRGEAHIDALQAELGAGDWDHAPAFDKNVNRLPIVAKLDIHRGDHAVRIAALPDRALERWSVVLGDAIHNLRTALDHAAWQLALEFYGGARPAKPTEVTFPVAGSSGDFTGHRACKHFLPTRLQTLRKFQPYNGRDGRLIKTLHDSDIDDKHKLLIPVLLRSRSFDGLATPRGAIRVTFTGGFNKPVEIGTQIMRVRYAFDDPDAKIKMDGYLTPGIHLRKRGHPVPFLRDSVDAIVRLLDELA